MPLLTWNDKYSVKIKIFDEQHVNLINMLNKLHEAMGQGKSKQVLGSLLNELIEYTKSHFQTEEKLMQQHNYPGYSDHAVEHQKLTDEVLKFKVDFDNDKLFISIKLLDFLKNWVTNHIMMTDKNYSDYFNQRGIS